MDTSLAFLGLVEARPAHGYELKQRYDDLFGAAKQLAFGQVYATLSRLERDGYIEMESVEEGSGPARKLYRGLPAGRQHVVEWLARTDEHAAVPRTNLFAKVVIALLLDEDAGDILLRQRRALLAMMREHTRAKQHSQLLDLLAHDHALFRIEADIRWIDLAEARLTELKESLAA